MLHLLNQADECLWAVFLPPVGRKPVHHAIHCRLHDLPADPPTYTTKFHRTPIPSISTSTASPFRSCPTPRGVPVAITSPGSRVHDAAYELHQFPHVDYQIGGVRVPHYLSVNARVNIRVRWIDFGDPGPKGVEALGARPLRSQCIPRRSFIALTSDCTCRKCIPYPG